MLGSLFTGIDRAIGLPVAGKVERKSFGGLSFALKY